MSEGPIGVVGGGLGGLACAVYLAKAGRQVKLFERRSILGGSARTQSLDGYQFNFGAHASYNSGAGADVLWELGVERRGGSPGLSVLAYNDRNLFPMSSGLKSLVTNRFLSVREKLKAMGVLGRLNKIDTNRLQSVTWTEWLESEVGPSNLSAFIETLFRLVTYANDPGIASVGPALEYLQRAYDGVLYLDGGWQTLVDSLAEKAGALGVEINTGTTAEALEPGETSNSLVFEDGRNVKVSAVVLAVDPKSAAKISGDRHLADWADSTRAVRSSALQVGLSQLPNPNAVYCLGVDTSLYFSVHSVWARLAPKGGASIELHKYLGTGIPSKPDQDRAELEAFLEVLQPGWRKHAVVTRFLPEMVPSTALVEASKDGLHGRYPVCSPTFNDLYFVGDWVGSQGNLSDATFASARLVSRLITQGMDPVPAFVRWETLGLGPLERATGVDHAPRQAFPPSRIKAAFRPQPCSLAWHTQGS